MHSSCATEDAIFVGDEVTHYTAEIDTLTSHEYPVTGSALLERLDRAEIGMVRGIVAYSSRPGVQSLTRLVTWLGNGWMYPAIAILLLGVEWQLALRLLIAGGASASICFAVYPLLKKRLARLRPFCVDSSIPTTSKPLDFYSCPSGHCMAATAVAIPLAIGVPHLWPAILISWMLIAWSRVSSGHHFPSDVAFGAILGTIIALPISCWLL